jgi:uncharacterized membrane protein HdeD (DUF308 family)
VDAIAAPVPPWLVLAQAVASVALATVQLTQPGADNLLTLLVLLGGYWLLGGVLELVGLAVDRRRWAWRLASAGPGLAAGFVVLREPLWSTLLVPPQVAPTIGRFGLAVAGVYLARMVVGGGRGALVLGTQSLVLGVMLLFGAPQVIVWGGAAVAGLGGLATLVFALRGHLLDAGDRVRRPRELTG